MKKYQTGSSLIEGLIAILIFSFGVLGTMSFQANMLAQSTQTSYRLRASMYINSLVGAAQADSVNFPCYTYPATPTSITTPSGITTNCAAAITYMSTWSTNAVAMPGSSTTPPTSIYDNTPTDLLYGTLTVTVYWKLPQEKSTDPVHSVSSTIQPTSGS